MRVLQSLGCSALIVGSLLSVVQAEDAAKISFKKHQLDDKFRSEGVAVGDFNHDGKLDVAAGSVYYAAPDWKMVSIEEKPNAYDPKGYSNTFCNFARDLNGDGWTDLIVVGFPGQETRWYENPQAAEGPWKMHIAVRVTNNESPQYLDVNGDGSPELLSGVNPDASNSDGPQRQMALSSPSEKATDPWKSQLISAPGAPGTQRFSHGVGAGDVNGDGRNDILVTEGWWEAPEKGAEGEWTFHKAPFGPACAQMHAFDFDGDGDNDVLTTSAHAYGIWWHEQKPEGAWETHEISKDFSQTHSVILVDINGDDLPDIVTGKRWWAHAAGDPGVDEPAVMCWFELQRKDGKPVWTPHMFDDNSGVGTQFEVADVNGDGLLDVVTANKKGAFYFEQIRAKP